MIDTSNWNLYWNKEGHQQVRANLVYSAYISPDKQHFCQWFARDPRYHHIEQENLQWTEQLLENRFRRELEFHTKASRILPTLPVVDIDEISRKIIFEWPGDDFLMQSYIHGSRESALPDWEQQWISAIIEMRRSGMIKLSLHPNSWTVRDGQLIPFNWFFTYDSTEQDSFENLLIQISPGRLEKMHDVLSRLSMHMKEIYAVDRLQLAALNSFRSNYDDRLIDSLIRNLYEENDRDKISR